MSNVRKIDTTQCQTFKDIFAKLWSITCNSCTFQRLDIIYNSYSPVPNNSGGEGEGVVIKGGCDRQPKYQ